MHVSNHGYRYHFIIMVVTAFLFACDKPARQEPVKTETKPHEDVGVSFSNVLTNKAWWLRLKFVPQTTTIRGIPADQLNSSWLRVSELRRGLIPEDLVSGKEGGFAWDPNFSVEGDFNDDGILDRALIGVYEDKSGKFGNFLLVLTQSSQGKWGKSYLKSFDGAQGPIDLTWDGKALTLWFCTSCDHVTWLEWNKEKNQYESRTPSYGVP